MGWHRKLRSLLILPLLTFFAISGRGQLVVDNNPTAQQLVQNVLVGKGVQVTNVTFSGANEQLGFFDATNANLMSIDSGLVMSSGEVGFAAGPNDQTNGTQNPPSGTMNGDPDLFQANGGISVNDVAILEFDFVPQGDTVRFDYVFGSEEYMLYANGSINDVFGFFISGPGINGPYSNNAENIAQIPGTNQAVTLNNVNATTNWQYYVDNGDNETNANTSPPPNFDTDSAYIQYDGHTTRLTAVSEVKCDSTYHLKIAIADGSDDIIDSGVFLKANSLTSNTVKVDVNTVSKDSSLVRGCTNATIDLIRPDTSDKDTVYFNFKGDAVNGGDYNYIPDSVIYQPGDSLKSITIQPSTDSLGTGVDTLLFEVPTVNLCGDTIIKDATIYIKDSSDYDLDVNAKDSVLLCPPTDSVPVWANVTNGTPDYDYIWEDTKGDSTLADTAKLPGTTTDSLFLTAVDSCNATGQDTSIVESKWDSLSIDSITPDTVFGCYGNSSIDLNVWVSGGAKPYSYNWSNGGSGSSISVFPTSTSVYTVTVTDSCSADQVTDSVLVEVPFDPIDIDVSTITADSSIVEGCTDGTFTFIRPDTSILDTLEYSISGNAINGTDYASIGDSVVYGPNDTSATVTIDALNDGIVENKPDTVTLSAYFVDLCGDTVRSEASLYIEEDYQVDAITSDSSIYCPTDSVPFHVQGQGGNPPYSYSWSDGSSDDSTQLPGDATDSLTVTVTDSCGKSSPADTVVLELNYDSLDLTVSNDTTLACPGDTVDLSASVSGGHSNYSYDWMPQNVNAPSVSVHPNNTSGYEVSVTDSCGNESLMDSVYVNVPEPEPVEAMASDTTVRCEGDSIDLLGSADSGYGGYSYQWIGGPSDSVWGMRSYKDTVYVLQVTDRCGNSDKDSSNVRQPDYAPLQIEAGPTDTTCQGENLKVDADASGGAEGYSYEWTGNGEIKMMDKGKAELDPEEGAYFKARVTDYCGEEASDEVYLGLEDCQIEVPNVFSPNGDGKNDAFAFGNLEHYPGSSLRVFNRWGNLVYESSDYDNDWEGGDLSDGTYYFVLEPSDPDTKTIKGEVTLFRDKK